MGKAILVMDMPSSCRECPLELQKFQCAVNSEIMKDNTIRQDWCQLKPMPSKKDDDFYDWGKANQVKGYNACIDELLKGEEV